MQRLRVQRKKTFLVVCFSLLISPLWAQIVPEGVLKNRPLAFQIPLDKEVTLLHPRPIYNGGWLAAMLESGGYTYQVPSQALLDAYGSGYYIGNLGYFCKKELQIEKSTHLPIHFRLGSLAEVNRLEAKPGW